MKKNVFLLFLFLFNINNIHLHCQQINMQNYGAIRQKISIRQYSGKQATLQVAIRVRQADINAAAILFLKVQNGNGQTGSVYYSSSPIYKNNWAIYTLSGIIDAEADSLSFGVLFNGQAMFCFDNFILSCNGQSIPFDNSDFENDTEIKKSHWSIPVLPQGFAINITTGMAYQGIKYLLIDGTGGKNLNVPGDNDVTGHITLINGVKIYYEVYGSGEPLLLLHGNQQAIGVFKEQISEFSKYYKVIAVDTRGQGKSSFNEKTYTYDLFADDMYQLLTELNIDSVNIVGWSDGGNTGLIMAMKYPKKVKKLVTMGACIFVGKSVVAKKTFNKVNKIINALKKDSSTTSQNTIRLYNLLLTEPRHTFEELKLISCPVLIMAGENDIIKTEHTKGIAANISQSQLLIIPKENHYYPIENSNNFNAHVLKFLGSR